ncbi:glycosyltransferase family 2 protein [Candidatus Peregrinibacteria bacterium]|nr:glycosyltransferase family 2 protein [Candidatus Peregrinibacteria bacterium]
MKLSVIVVNYNQKYFPKMCLEAIKKSQVNFPYEIIFVDNASSDESIAFLREAAEKKEIILIESPENLGYGSANNLGAKEANGTYLLFMNPDVSVNEDSLQNLVDFIESADSEVFAADSIIANSRPEKIGILGPKIVYHNGQIQESCRRFMTFTDLVIKRTPLKYLPRFRKRLSRYIMSDFDHESTQEVDLIVGACFLFPKVVFEKLGCFDERFFLFMEDFDLCQKAHQAGYRVVYFPKTSVTHFHKRLSDGGLLSLPFKKVFWHHLMSSARYFWRWRNVKEL